MSTVWVLKTLVAQQVQHTLAFPKTEEGPPTLPACPVHHYIPTTEHTLLYLLYKLFYFFEELIHRHGKTAKYYKRVHSDKLPRRGQPSVPCPLSRVNRCYVYLVYPF